MLFLKKLLDQSRVSVQKKQNLTAQRGSNGTLHASQDKSGPAFISGRD